MGSWQNPSEERGTKVLTNLHILLGSLDGLLAKPFVAKRDQSVDKPPHFARITGWALGKTLRRKEGPKC